MSRLTLTVCMSVLVILMYVSPSRACMNDRETIRTESEFKKHYEFKSTYQQKKSAEPPTTEKRWVPLVASFSGLGLLAGSVVLVGFNLRRGRRG